MNPDELNRALEQLRINAADANAEGDLERWYQFQEAIDQLQEWRDNGIAGDCPVDLADYGLAPKAEEAEQGAALGAWTQAVRSAGEKLESGDLVSAITELTVLLDGAELPAEVRRQARHLLGEAQQQKARRIDELMKGADALEEAHDWDGAQQAYDEVLLLAPRYRDAHARTEALWTKRREEEARALLRQENDVQALDEGLTKARQLFGAGLGAEWRSMVERAERRRDELRAEAGEITTLLALDELQSVYVGVLRVRHLLEKGSRTFYDAAKGVYAPITEYYANAREAWKKASTDFAERVLNRVQNDLGKAPAEAARKLRVALDTSLCKEGESVSDARERIEGEYRVRLSEDELNSTILHEEIREDLETHLEEVEVAVARHNEALELIEKAEDTAELVKAWKLLATAKEVNPGLEDVNRSIEMEQHSLEQRLAGKVREERAQAESLMVRHDFGQARNRCFEGMKLAGTFGEAPGVVAEELSSVQQVLKRIDEAEQRQESTRKWDLMIREALRAGNVAHAVKLYEEMDRELRSDPGIKELSLHMAGHQELERVEADAKRAFDDHDWHHAVDLCDVIINRGGPLAEWAKELRSQARTELLFAQVEEQFEQGYYQQAKRTLEDLLKLDRGLASRCQPYQDQIDELSKGDDQVKRRLTRARREAREDRLEAALESYESILGAATSYAGEIRDEYEDVQDQLRRYYARRLDRELRKKKPDYEAAFHWAETLKSHALLWEEEDRQLWRSAVQGYHTARIAGFEGRGRWSEAMEEWEALEAAIGSTVQVVEGLHHARQRATLDKVDAHLRRLEWEEAAAVLEGAMGLGVMEDEDLAWRRSIIEAVKRADLLFGDGHYEDMLECLVDAHEQYGCDVLLHEREKLTKEAVRTLVQEADKESEDASGDQLVDMISKYVRARDLDPQDKRAERGIARIKAKLPGVMSQVFAEARAFTSAGRPLEESLQDARSQASRLRALISLVPHTEQPEEWQMKLSSVLRPLEASINDLEQVSGYLQRAPQDGEVWQGAVRSGDFRPLEGALRAAREIDADLAEVRDYARHLEEAVHGRREAMGQIAELRKAFEQDDFWGVITACQSLRAAKHLAPYLRLLESETRLYDFHLGEEIVGLLHHQEMAKRKQANLDAWDEWAVQAERLRARLDDRREHIDREQQPLGEVVTGLEACLRALGDAVTHSQKRPQEILSWKAHDLASAAEEGAEELAKMSEDLEKRLHDARQDLAQVQDELQPKIGQAIKKRQWAQAEELLKQAESLDPHDKLTKHLRRALEEAKVTEPSRLRNLRKKVGRIFGPR